MMSLLPSKYHVELEFALILKRPIRASITTIFNRTMDGQQSRVSLSRVRGRQVFVVATWEKFDVLWCDVVEQRAIARILSALDDKIELNRRMNETLELIARSIYKSWFVDFDPVRAIAEGRDSGLPKPLANLFPDCFQYSELGEVPKGWKLRTVENVCSAVLRGVTPKYEVGSQRYIINQRVNRGAHLDLTEIKELARVLDVPAACYAKTWDVLVNCCSVREL